jgi:hypothetical protein
MEIASHAFHFKKRDVGDEKPALLSKLDTMISHHDAAMTRCSNHCNQYHRIESHLQNAERAVILCERLLSPGR